MVLVTLIFLTSLLCLLISLLSFGLIVRHLYFKGEEFKKTSSDEAILISGCDSGIGLELAKYFHKTCKYKIICGFLNPKESNGFKELDSLRQSDAHDKERLILKELDLRCNKDVDNIVELIEQFRKDGRFKGLAALINNAGILTYGEFDWLTWNQMQNQIDVNLVGTLRLTRAIVPYIIESKGRIINVSSVNDTTVFPGLSIYSATKSALSTFSRGLGYELRKFGASVITIRLGDFARLTNIMASQASHQDHMWQEMNTKKKTMYKDFFHEFNKHLLKNYGMTSPKEFEDSSLFRDFELALLSKNPPTTITCAPLEFKLFYFLVELMPVWLQYYLLDLLMQFGFQWKPPKVIATE